MMLSPGQQAPLGGKKWKVDCVGHGFKWLKQASKPTRVCDTLPLIQTTYTCRKQCKVIYTMRHRQRQQFKKRKGDFGSEISEIE